MSPARFLLAACLAAPLAAGCPIPQAVPEYPKGTSVTPPRIVAESAMPAATLIQVPAGCMPPTFDLWADIVDEDVREPVEARWFVDYEPTSQSRSPWVEAALVPTVDQPDPNAPITTRSVVPYAFAPYDFGGSPGAVHVVELVVSNGFDPSADVPTDGEVPARPFRTPLTDFETQVYRWVFLLTSDPCP